MSSVAIVTDSVASIPVAISKELKICWVPYYIHRGKEVLRDLISIDYESFYRWLPDAIEYPTTANPSSFDYQQVSMD